MSAMKKLFAPVEELENVTKKATATRVVVKRACLGSTARAPCSTSTAHKRTSWSGYAANAHSARCGGHLPAKYTGAAPRVRLQPVDEDLQPQEEHEAQVLFKFSVEPVQCGGHPCAGRMDATNAEKMVAAAEKRAMARAQAVVAHAAEQLFKVVNHMHSRLHIEVQKTGGEFHNCISVETSRQIVPIVRRSTSPTTPVGEAVRAGRRELALYSPDELRSNMETRAKAAETASKSLAKKLSSLLMEVTSNASDVQKRPGDFRGPRRVQCSSRRPLHQVHGAVRGAA